MTNQPKPKQGEGKILNFVPFDHFKAMQGEEWTDIDKIIFKNADENEFGNLFIWEDSFDILSRDIAKLQAKTRSSAIRETVEEIKKDLGRIFEERHNEAINILMIKNYLNSLKEKQP